MRFAFWQAVRKNDYLLSSSEIIDNLFPRNTSHRGTCSTVTLTLKRILLCRMAGFLWGSAAGPKDCLFGFYGFKYPHECCGSLCSSGTSHSEAVTSVIYLYSGHNILVDWWSVSALSLPFKSTNENFRMWDFLFLFCLIGITVNYNLCWSVNKLSTVELPPDVGAL